MGITYESIGSTRITVAAGSDGITLTANPDGLASLAKLLGEMAYIAHGHDHVHLTPSL